MIELNYKVDFDSHRICDYLNCVDECCTTKTLEKYTNITELAYLLSYIDNGYKVINPYLISNEKSNFFKPEEYEFFIENLDSILNKLPEFNIPNQILYRQESNWIENYKMGEIIIYRNYVSTSLDDFDNSNYILKITTKYKNTNARQIYSLLNQSEKTKFNEKEILFKRDATFKIIDISTKNNKKYFNLTEV